MTDADRIASLEREVRLLRIMLDMHPRTRTFFERLLRGRATLDELMTMIETDRGIEACTPQAAYNVVRTLRRNLRPHGISVALLGREGIKLIGAV